MRVLWLSRHEPLPRQRAELARLFGDVVIEQDARSFDSAEDIAERFRQGGYDEIVVVAPMSVIARLIDLRLRPLWAEMTQVEVDEAEVTMGRVPRLRHFRFSRFRRVMALRFDFEDFE